MKHLDDSIDRNRRVELENLLRRFWFCATIQADIVSGGTNPASMLYPLGDNAEGDAAERIESALAEDDASIIEHDDEWLLQEVIDSVIESRHDLDD